jgi:hypothetical protein
MFTITIRGSKRFITTRGKRVGNKQTWKRLEDTTDKTVHYQDLRHAMVEAQYLKTEAAENPAAVVHTQKGEPFHGKTMPLLEWIAFCETTELPPIAVPTEVLVEDVFEDVTPEAPDSAA